MNNKIKYLSRCEKSNELSFDCDGEIVRISLAQFRADDEFGRCMNRDDLVGVLLCKGYELGRAKAECERYEFELVSWTERPECQGVVVRSDNQYATFSYSQVDELKGKIDPDTWGQICWRKGFMDGYQDAKRTYQIEEQSSG